MGRTIIGKYLPVLLAVSLFVAAGFQRRFANMGYFSLFIAHGGNLEYGDATRGGHQAARAVRWA